MSKFRVTASIYVSELRDNGEGKEPSYTFGGQLNSSVSFDTDNLDFRQMGKLMEAFHTLQEEWKGKVATE